MEESRKARNISNVERDDLDYFAENCMSQNIFSNIRAIDVLNFVRNNTSYHDDYYLEFIQYKDFGENGENEYKSQKNKMAISDIDLIDLDKLEKYVPKSYMMREVLGFSIELDEKSIIISLA